VKHNKLVRDRIPELIRENGGVAITRILDQSELRRMLEEKLREEVEEFLSGREAEELVDVLEVVYALASERGVSEDELEHLRQIKRTERGGFDDGIFLIEAIDEGETGSSRSDPTFGFASRRSPDVR